MFIFSGNACVSRGFRKARWVETLPDNTSTGLGIDIARAELDLSKRIEKQEPKIAQSSSGGKGKKGKKAKCSKIMEKLKSTLARMTPSGAKARMRKSEVESLLEEARKAQAENKFKGCIKTLKKAKNLMPQ